MLGDIVPNNTNPAGGTATAVRPSPAPVTPLASANGFGASSFTGATQAIPTAPSPQPIQAKPYVAATSVSQPELAVQNSDMQTSPVTTSTAATKRPGTKLPLILTITGVVIFIGGVAGLFIYALGG